MAVNSPPLLNWRSAFLQGEQPVKVRRNKCVQAQEIPRHQVEDAENGPKSLSGHPKQGLIWRPPRGYLMARTPTKECLAARQRSRIVHQSCRPIDQDRQGRTSLPY